MRIVSLVRDRPVLLGAVLLCVFSCFLVVSGLMYEWAAERMLLRRLGHIDGFEQYFRTVVQEMREGREDGTPVTEVMSTEEMLERFPDASPELVDLQRRFKELEYRVYVRRAQNIRDKSL